jgi:hypothetical protein
MHPEFSWYTEWVRPRTSTGTLPIDIGQRLSTVLDNMEVFSFDFRSRPVPPKADFCGREDGSSATCTTMVRVPLIRAGIEDLAFPTTAVHEGAYRNLERIGLEDVIDVHTPSNILLDAGHEYVGFVDNANPEAAYANRLVLGRPEIFDSLGGWMSQRTINPKNLPEWHKVGQWQAAWRALEVSVGQSNSFLGDIARTIVNIPKDAVPKSASPAVIAFYLTSELEAAHIARGSCELVFRYSANSIPGPSSMHNIPEIQENIGNALGRTQIHTNGWYQ